jgi:deazaflavin-dependent oxidoreductase (nitroreductase family)
VAPAGRDVVLLTTRGRRTGRDHTVLIQAFHDGEDIVLVVANAGRGTLPDWYCNLISAGSAIVERRGQRLTARPVVVDPETAAALWPRILEIAPTYARYAKLAGSDLPLVRLVTEPANASAGR